MCLAQENSPQAKAGKQCLTGKPKRAISHEQEIDAAFRARDSVNRPSLDRIRGKPRIPELPPSWLRDALGRHERLMN
jgi:hypothetical protein